MVSYSIMPLDTDHLEEICQDIRYQYENKIATCALFCMTLVPEGNPPMDKAGALCEKYELFRNRLAEMGLECGVLVQATIGHGWQLDEMFPFQPYTNLTDGQEIQVCCPYDEAFREHFRRQFATIAAHKPAMIMVDDDFRLMFRDGRGCACPRHMAEFNRRAGTNMTREELYQHILGCSDENKRLADIFIETQGDAIIGAARVYREGIDSVDASIPGSFCLCGNAGEFALDAAEILKGQGMPTIIRLNNGAYTPQGPHEFSRVMHRAALQAALIRDKTDIMLAETDTCPQNRYSTSAHFLHSHYVATILVGVKGAKQWITRLSAYELKSGMAYRKILSDHAGFYEKLMELVPQAEPLGCRIPLLDRPTYFGDDKGVHEDGWHACVLERLGLPLYFSEKDGGTAFLSGNADAKFTDEELRTLLSGSVFLASDTAQHLIHRGLGEYLGVSVRPWKGAALSYERVEGQCETVQKDCRELVILDPTVQTVSTVFHLENGRKELPLFPGVTLFKNALGGTVVVFAGTPKAKFDIGAIFSFLNESRKVQMVKLLRAVGQLPVYFAGDEEMFLHAAKLPGDRLMCTFFNLGCDPCAIIPLCVDRRVKTVERLMPDGSFTSCEFEQEADQLNVHASCNTLDPLVLLIR